MSCHEGTANNYEKTLTWITIFKTRLIWVTQMHYAIFQHKEYTFKLFCNQPVVKSHYHTFQGVVTDVYEAEVNDGIHTKAEKCQKNLLQYPFVHQVSSIRN
jgi:hypothetical protein